ncbi:hypothetical protein Btru_044156 [Bulinus truncatus]|nr:hypothetical protein Btru_044156 [Bulinus truncatus]
MGGAVSSMEHLDTVTKRLEHLYRTDPGKELFVFYESGVRDPYTAGDLYTLAGRFARRLRQQGFRKGDVIANTLNNSPERVVTDLGIMLAGCVSMNVQLLLADGSDFILSAKNSRCSGVVLSSEEEGPAWELMVRFMGPQTEVKGFRSIRMGEAPDLTTAILISRSDNGKKKLFLDDLRNSLEEEVYLCPAEPDDLLTVLTTSGSTGYSKLVPRTQAEILDHEKAFGRIFHTEAVRGNRPDKPFKYYSDRTLGWSVGVPFAAFYHGDTRVLTDTFMAKATRTGKEIWEAVVKEEITFCMFLCLELDIVWEHIESIGGTDHTLKTVVSGGQPLRKSQMERFLVFSETLVIMYGSTEAGVLTANRLQRGDVLRSHNSGRAIEGVEIRIVSEDGQPCQVNQTGTLEVRAPGVLKGYFNRLVDPDPQTVQAFTPDDWFMMSDYGHADEEGNIFVYGRAKDIIVYGGDLFYPGWMEKMLTKHADILEAIVVPVSDPVLYHNICACVKVRKDSELDEEGLRKHCDAIFLTNLGFSNTPHPKFFIITKDGFPLTSTGKPNKQRLREMAEERFGCNKDSV